MDATASIPIENHRWDDASAAPSLELTLEAALAFIDDCSIESDDETGASVATGAAAANRHAASGSGGFSGTQRPKTTAVTAGATAAPLSFYELVDTIESESDSEYVSIEEALKMLDTCEIDEADCADGGGIGARQQQQHSSAVAQRAKRTSFTEPVRGDARSSSDSDVSSDTSATASVSSTKTVSASRTRKPKQRTASMAAATPKCQPETKKSGANASRAKTAKKQGAAAAAAEGEVATSTAKPTKKRVRKQREELLYLREKVVEMQGVLESLQKSSQASVTTSSSSSSSASSPTSASISPLQQQQQGSAFSTSPSPSVDTEDSLCGGLWETLAEKHLRERERAEQENRQLRATLEGQIKLVQSLEQLLIGPHDIEIPGSTSHSKRVKMHAGRDGDPAILMDLKEELRDAYSLFEQDFAASYLRDLRVDGGDIQVKSTPERGMHVEFSASKVVQHGFETTRRGVWRFMSRDGLESQCVHYTELEEPTHSFTARDFEVKLERKYRDVNIHVKQVLKKVEMERREVFLWSAVVEPVKFSDASTLPGVRFRERGWLVMEPLGEGDVTGTIVKTFVTFTPDLDESVSAKSMAVGAITDLVVDSVEGNIHLCQDMLDQFILEEERQSNRKELLSTAA